MGLPQKDRLSEHFDELIELAKSTARIEKKFNLHYGQSLFLKRELVRSHFRTAYESRVVNSIYFDNSDLVNARENINGDKNRTKFRLRYYGVHPAKANLEVKIKQGMVGYKISVPFDFIDDITSDLNLKNAARILSNYAGYALFPQSTVNYKRNYYIHPSGTRATVDTQISTERVVGTRYSVPNRNLFEVLELKYDQALDSYVRKEIFPGFKALSIRATKSSKYIRSVL